MDLNSLKDQVTNLSLYDLKAGFRKAQNGKCESRRQRRRMLMKRSRNELHRDGGEGARGDKQRAMGYAAEKLLAHVVTNVLPRCLFVADAGNRQWHIQLVGGSLCPRGRFDSRRQPIAQRNHAYDVQTLHRESCRGMEADLQSKAILLTCYNAYS
jgi:ssDNA-binding Zn-finger/Zn-ribbon topoisomerase 1